MLTTLVMASIWPAFVIAQPATQLYIGHGARLTAEIPSGWTVGAWLSRYDGSDGFVVSIPIAGDTLDIECVVADGRHDLASASIAINLLKQERRSLNAWRRQVNRDYRRRTANQLRTIARSRQPALNEYMLSRAVAQANDLAEAVRRRDQQVAALDVRRAALDRAIHQLELKDVDWAGDSDVSSASCPSRAARVR